MSDKSFGDYANRNIVKNPLLSTAVTGLSIEDLTHNAVLVPVAPNQGLITGLDQVGFYKQALENTDNEITNLPSGDSNCNILLPQPSISTHSYTLDSQPSHQYSPKPEILAATVSKASVKSEDDFDVNEYFARLQGTRYVSAPLHTHQDPNANLTDAEENLEEINLNDDKNIEIQQSLTADIAQNFSQLPNVLPHVASAVFSSFSNMWNMKSREQTPDDRTHCQDVQFNQGSHQLPSNQGSYQDVQFHGGLTPGFGHVQESGSVASVPLMRTEEVAKEVAPPPKEPPVCGTTSFRLATKKKYAQIPGLSTKEIQPIAFNPVTTNVPSYFIPTEDVVQTQQNEPEIQQQNITRNEQNDNNIYNIVKTDVVAVASDCQPSVFMPTDQPKITDEPDDINLQNQLPVIPPPPMFAQRKDNSQTGKSVLPPSVARRIGSNHPVIKQTVIQPPVTNIFVPMFDIAESEANLSTDHQLSSIPMFASSISQQEPPKLPTPSPASQMSAPKFLPTPPQIPSVLKSAFSPLSSPKPSSNLVSIEKTSTQIFNPIPPVNQAIFTPVTPDSAAALPSNSSFSQGAATLPPTSSIFAPPQTLPPGPTQPTIATNLEPTLFIPPTNTAAKDELPPDPPKPPIEPPKAVGGNFRMTKKRPQYYSGPIEGFGSISNSIKPIIPTVSSETFQGALFTPEQPKADNAPTFDINQQTQPTAISPFDITNSPTGVPTTAYSTQPVYPTYEVNQPAQNYTQCSTSFDLSRPTDNYEYQESKESKGFGIIGSLKSKLSSLDINKIQNSVTTFFDPAFNDSKNDVTTTQENIPYQPQYGTQSNIEIFVPQVEQSQPIYNYTDQSSNQGYPNQYTYQQNTQYPTQNVSYLYPAKYYLPPQSNQNQITNVFSQNITTDITAFNTMKSNFDTSNPLEHIDTQNTEIGDDIPDYIAQTISAVISTDDTAPITKSNLLLGTKEVDNKSLAGPAFESNRRQSKESTDLTFNKPAALPLYEYSQYGNPSAAYLPAIEPTNSSLYPGKILDENKIIPTSPFALATKTNTKEVKHALGAFPNVTLDKIEKEMKPDVFMKEQRVVKDEIPKGDSLLESLTKGEVPILAVASVPLFGLSAIIADKSKEETSAEINLPLFDKNQSVDLDTATSLSFFENLGSLPQKSRDKNDNNKSFSFFETPTEKEADLPQIPSVSFFTNKLDDCDTTNDVMLDRKTTLFDNLDAVAKEFGLNNDVVLDSEESGIQDDTESVSELNICETCREFNKPEDRELEIEDMTTHLIGNITSPIQLSNAVEVPLTEDGSNERGGYDAEQYDEISHITEETRDTINVQSATELLDEDDVSTMNFGWATENKFITNPVNNEFGYKVDSSSIGFYGGNLFSGDNVPTNASDELKAEYKHQEDIVPRQISIPSAPPAEEDTKADESGSLDVHSIELDAKDDFPLYEAFVIEPSETDDDKIELKREKTEESELDSFTNRVEKFKKMEEVDVETKIRPKYFELTSQPITMASYFDTGNYAADTHYRNTMNSPNHFSIPPGFEEEFKRKLSLAEADVKKVPDTNTQTHTTTSVSFTTAHSTFVKPHYSFTTSVMPVGFNVEANISKIVDDKPETQTADLFGDSITIPNASSIFCAAVEESKSPSRTVSKPQDIIGSGVKISEASNIFGASDTIPTSSSLFDKIAPATSTEKVTTSDKKDIPKLPDSVNFFVDSTPPENFSRLASYFSTPPKTDHAKSFFELSQSQNHYRHAIPEKYQDLIKDLTSVQNLAIPAEQNIKQINYFTLEHEVVSPEFSTGDNLKDDSNDKELDSLTNCKQCVNLILNKRYKVRAAVNGTNDNSSSVPSMEQTMDSHNTRNSVTVNFEDLPMNEEADEGVGAVAENRSTPEYTPVKHHWFYRVDIDDKSIWRGFSIIDSRALETAYLSPELNENTVVPTDGGRYDVNIIGRLRMPVYWSDKPTNVLRCSWFYKGTTDPRYVPYTEIVADKLETEYHHGITTGVWHRRLLLPNGEVVVMHGPSVMVHFLSSDAFTTPPYFSFGKRVYRNPPKIRVSRDVPHKIDHLIFMVHGAGEYRSQKEKNQSTSRPRVVRRGHDESEIEDPEPSSIDHLLLLCHGVGSACDMRFRSVEEVVEDFRSTSLQLVQSHYKNSYEQGVVNRVEILPISWHATLHSGETGVDRRLAQITLDSIPRLRNFTNDTVLDVLFYTSPVFCQTILNTVCKELNRIYDLFRQRNPTFDGGISLGGHSLGSVILYDLLCHQIPEGHQDKPKSTKSYVSGNTVTGDISVQYPRLKFEPDALYALGSPIAIFECIRGVESLGMKFSLPTCKNFFNIFHPYDPIAYRIEPLINPLLRDLKPYLIPHHKGRKRMHLELKDTMARVGADLKQKLLESIRSTWNKWKAQPVAGTLDRVVEATEMDAEPLCDDNKEETAKEKELSTPEMLGHLNAGRRVDYVLQEAPLEMINEYLFAMSSHVGYWESEDTMLLILREIYSALGVQPDSTVPQQSMCIERTRTQDSRSILNTEYPSTSGTMP